REELRRTIRQVQRELGITTVLVTHDQEEAFAMADRIGIMNHGRLLEMGAPHDLYSRPATRFVATFLGAANLLLARRTPDGIQMGVSTVAAAERSPDLGEHEVVAVVRPEEVELAASRDALKSGYLARGVVDEVMFSGALESLRVRLANGAQAPPLEPHLGVPDAPSATDEPSVGATAIAGGSDCSRRAEWLLRRGAREVLVLPEQPAVPQRVLIHWMSDASRSATLAVSASVLRHVAAEAVYVSIFPEERAGEQRHGLRELLDARSEAQLAHGLEMRTELRFGDVASELAA